MITINLNKAQKLLEKFKTNENVSPKQRRMRVKWSTEPESTYSCVLKYPIKRFVTEDEMKNDIDKMLIQMKAEFNNHWIFDEDKRKLKNAIFRENMKCGLYDVLTEIEALNSKKEILKQMISTVLYHTIKQESVPNSLKRVKEMTDTVSEVELAVEVFDKTDIENMITEISKKINTLEERKDVLNASNTISVELRPETVKMLGL